MLTFLSLSTGKTVLMASTTVLRNTFTVPFYKLRKQALSVVCPTVKEMFATCEEAVRAVNSAKPKKKMRGVTSKELKGLQKRLQLPSHSLHSNFAAML